MDINKSISCASSNMTPTTSQVTSSRASEPTAQQLQIDLHVLKNKLDRLERENWDLKASIRKTINDSALGRELQVLVEEREKMLKHIEQLKSEKGHLVESVLLLSGEVDDLQKEKAEEQLKFKEELSKYNDFDKKLRTTKYRLGMQIIDVLNSNKVDPIIVQDIQLIVTKASMYGSRSNDDKNITNNNNNNNHHQDSNIINDNKISSSQRSNFDNQLYAALKSNVQQQKTTKNEEIYIERKFSTLESLRDSDYNRNDDIKKSKSGEMSENRSSDGRSRRGKSPGRRRKKDVLEREETDSIISSVSTHRSGKSSYTNKTSQSNKSKKSNKSNGFELTKEALDKLNNINQGNSPTKPNVTSKELSNSPKKGNENNATNKPATTPTPTTWWGLF